MTERNSFYKDLRVECREWSECTARVVESRLSMNDVVVWVILKIVRRLNRHNLTGQIVVAVAAVAAVVAVVVAPRCCCCCCYHHCPY